MTIRNTALVALGVILALTVGSSGLAAAAPHPRPSHYWTLEFTWPGTGAECSVQTLQKGGILSSVFSGTYTVKSSSVNESFSTPMSQISFGGTWSKKDKRYSGKMIVTGYEAGAYPARLVEGVVRTWDGGVCVGDYSTPGPRGEPGKTSSG